MSEHRGSRGGLTRSVALGLLVPMGPALLAGRLPVVRALLCITFLEALMVSNVLSGRGPLTGDNTGTFWRSIFSVVVAMNAIGVFQIVRRDISADRRLVGLLTIVAFWLNLTFAIAFLLATDYCRP